MRRLYARLRLQDGRHGYIPLVQGRHVRWLFRSAEKAQTHSESVMARHKRLKIAQRWFVLIGLAQMQRERGTRQQPGRTARRWMGWRKLPEIA